MTLGWVPSNWVTSILHQHQVTSNQVPLHRYRIGIGCCPHFWLADIPGLIKSEKKGRQKLTPSNSCSSLLKFYLLFNSICCHLHIIVLLQFSKIFW
jgi:hypothetical protein